MCMVSLLSQTDLELSIGNTQRKQKTQEKTKPPTHTKEGGAGQFHQAPHFHFPVLHQNRQIAQKSPAVVLAGGTLGQQVESLQRAGRSAPERARGGPQRIPDLRVVQLAHRGKRENSLEWSQQLPECWPHAAG